VVRAGVEVGYELGLEGTISDFLQRWPFDFVLGAIHVLDHIAITAGEELEEFRRSLMPRGAEYLASRYFEYVRAAAGSGLFDCVAHLDIWRKYVVPEAGEGFVRAVEPLVEPMVRAVARSGAGLEVNTSALRRGQSEPYPSRDILMLAVESGVRTFTVGSDSHSPEALGAGVRDATELLRGLGITPARFARRARC
jgi:histidinol-phosphatase (PHP family)